MQINDNILLRLERVGFSIARLYFINNEQAEINIPANLLVVDQTNGNAQVQPLLSNQYFVLAWSVNYAVIYDGVSIMGLTNQRQWAVSGLRESQVQVLDA